MNSEDRLTRAAELADEFAARRQRGGQPRIEDYIAAHPDLGEEIAEMFPAVLMLEGLEDPVAETAAFSQRAAEIPQMIGDCRIIREIGRGGMGVVYEAEQLSMQRRVAVKVLPRHVTANSKTLQRFQLEAKSAGRLNHSNIVPVYEVAEHDGLWYYVMQFVAGLGLDDVLRQLQQSPNSSVFYGRNDRTVAATVRGDLDTTIDESMKGVLPGLSGTHETEDPRRDYFRSIAQIGIQVANALTCAHSNGIVHRDIKPSNLMLDADANVWVTDFGLVKTDDVSLTETGDLLGTLRYMAPERFQGESDARGDVYGLAVTLYELLTLQPAFQGHDRVALIHQVTTVDPPRPRALDSRIPRDLETIVLKAMSREPGGRYQSASAFAADLTAFVEDRPIQARPTGAVEQAGRWARRNKLVTSALAFAVLSLVVGSAFSIAMWLNAANRAEEARVAQGSAEANLEIALGVVRRFYRITSNDADLPADLRERLAQECLKYDEHFVAQDTQDPALRAELANSYERIAMLKWRYVKAPIDDASSAMQKASEILSELNESHPSSQYQLRHAALTVNMGALELGRGNYTKALALAQQGQRELTPLCKTEVHAWDFLAKAMGNEGLVHRARGDIHKTELAFVREVAVRRAALKQRPNDTTVRRGITTSHLHLGHVLADCGKLNKARSVYETAVAARPGPTTVREAMEPGLAGLRLEEAAACAKLSRVCIALGDFDAARVAATRGLELTQDLRRQRPFVKLVHGRWGLIYAEAENALAQALYESGLCEEAAKHAKLACEAMFAYGKVIPKQRSVEGTFLQDHVRISHNSAFQKECLKPLRDGVALCRKSNQKHHRIRHGLGRSLGVLVDAETKLARSQAGGHITEAIRIHEALREQYPDHVEYTLELARHYRRRARLIQPQGIKSRADLQRSLELFEGDRQASRVPQRSQRRCKDAIAAHHECRQGPQGLATSPRVME